MFLFAWSAQAAQFTFVMINADTEALYGSVPFDRKLMARAIDNVMAAGAKGVVVKFFFDRPSNDESDKALEDSICGTPVLLQACLEPGGTNATELDSRFQVPGVIPAGLIGGEAGVLPLPRFMHCARAVGFVDFQNESELPLVESYRGHIVKSLHLAALELAVGKSAEIDASGTVRLGGKNIGLRGVHPIKFPKTNSLEYIPFHEVLTASPEKWRDRISKSVVIIGYDGKKIHTIPTPLGEIGAHRYFIFSLLSVAEAYRESLGEK